MTSKYAFILPDGKKEFKHIQNALMKCGFIWVGRENDKTYRMEYEWLQRGGTYMYFESQDVMNVRQSNFSSMSSVKYSLQCSNYKIVTINDRTFDDCTTKAMVFERLETLYKSMESDSKVPKKEDSISYRAKRPVFHYVDDPVVEAEPAAISMSSTEMLTVRASIKSNKVITFNNSLLTIKTKS